MLCLHLCTLKHRVRVLTQLGGFSLDAARCSFTITPHGRVHGSDFHEVARLCLQIHAQRHDVLHCGRRLPTRQSFLCIGGGCCSRCRCYTGRGSIATGSGHAATTAAGAVGIVACQRREICTALHIAGVGQLEPLEVA